MTLPKSLSGRLALAAVVPLLLAGACAPEEDPDAQDSEATQTPDADATADGDQTAAECAVGKTREDGC